MPVTSDARRHARSAVSTRRLDGALCAPGRLGRKVASLKRGETLTLQLSDDGASIQVAMGSSRSPALRLLPWNGSVDLECGSARWVPFDLLNLAYVQPFSERVFFIREIARA